jgi:hypothetical protein
MTRWLPNGHRSTGVFPPGEVGDEPAHREIAEGALCVSHDRHIGRYPRLIGPDERFWRALGDGHTRLITHAQGTCSHLAELPIGAGVGIVRKRDLNAADRLCFVAGPGFMGGRLHHPLEEPRVAARRDGSRRPW